MSREHKSIDFLRFSKDFRCPKGARRPASAAETGLRRALSIESTKVSISLGFQRILGVQRGARRPATAAEN